MVFAFVVIYPCCFGKTGAAYASPRVKQVSVTNTELNNALHFNH